MREEQEMSEESTHSWTKPAYVKGLVFSLILTISAWLLIKKHVDSHHTFLDDKLLIAVILVLAIVQLIVQLVFFLHLGRESKPRWNLSVLGLAVLVLLILVLGSLWIMYNLDYRHPHKALSPSQLNKSIINDEGINH